MVTIIPIVSGAFGTVTKGLLKGLEDLEVCGRVETIQTTALLRMARIQWRVLETWVDLLLLKHFGVAIHASCFQLVLKLVDFTSVGSVSDLQLKHISLKRGIYQGCSLSSLPIVIATMALNYTLSKFADWGNKKRIDPFIYMDDKKNTEKSPGGLRRLVVTRTPVKNHQLTLM